MLKLYILNRKFLILKFLAKLIKIVEVVVNRGCFP